MQDSQQTYKKVNNWFVLANDEWNGVDNYTLINRPSHMESWIEFLYKKWPHKKENSLFLDVGANYGFISRPLSNMFAETHAFEVRPDVFYCLQENTKHINNIFCHNVAVGSKNDSKAFYEKNNTSAFTKVSYTREVNHLSCDMRTIDSYNFENVDLIKIDVEGLDLDVIFGAVKTIEKCKPLIITEAPLSRSPLAIKYRHDFYKMFNYLDYKFVDTARNDLCYEPNL